MADDFVTVHVGRDLSEHQRILAELEEAGIEALGASELSAADVGGGDALLERPIRVRESKRAEALELISALLAAPGPDGTPPPETESELDAEHRLLRRRRWARWVAALVLLGPLGVFPVTYIWALTRRLLEVLLSWFVSG